MLVWLLAVPGTVSSQEPASKEQATLALKEYEEFAKHNNPHVRKAALDELAGVDHHLVTTALLAALEDKSPVVREAALRGLERQRNDLGMSEMIRRMWHGRDKDERIAILQAMKRIVPPVALSAVQELTAHRDWEIRVAATELLGCYPDDGEGAILGTLLPLLDDKEPLVRLAAIDALQTLGNPRGQQGALKAIEDSDWRIRASAVRAMRTFRLKSSVQPLIDLYRKEKGRLQDDAAAALNDLTGRDSTGDADKWQEWWDRVKDGFKIPTREEIEAAKKKANERRPGYDPPKKGEYAPYHGIKTRSRNMLFVIDKSTSMADLISLDENNREMMADFQQRYGELRVKIDIAREELINMVASLPAYARFNIITFNAEVDTFQKTLVPATDGNKNKAIKYLARLTVSNLTQIGGFGRGGGVPGQTNTFEAINACFGLVDGQVPDKNSYKTDADTVFLLTDGMPTTGRIVEPEPLLQYVAAVNKKAKLVFHCIAFGSSNRPLMQSMAENSGGQFVQLGL